MGACKNHTRWRLLAALAWLAVSSGGCSYALRPIHWLVHNTVPSTCKTCPGGLPGSNGCRSFANPWCAGYETTLWQPLGHDCGPARLPSALAGIDQAGAANVGTESSEQSSGDAPPALPDAFPNPLPEPGNLPPALPDLPASETDLPPAGDFPFPVSPVPSSPPEEDPANPLRNPSETGTPGESPDLFPESRPPNRPPEEKEPASTDEKAPTQEPPLMVPEKIDDLFNTPGKPAAKEPSSADPKLPDDFPSFENAPAPKKPEALPEPERKTPAKVPMSNAVPTPNELPKPFNEGDTKSAPANTTPNTRAPNKIPALPPLSEPTPSGNQPDLRPDSKSQPAPGEEDIPKLFDDNVYQPLPELRRVEENNSTLRFGRVIPAVAEEEPILRVQPAGGTVDLGGGFYGPYHALPGPPRPLLRIKQ